MGDRWHGLRFPFRNTARGLFTEPSDEEAVSSSISFILSTGIGEYITLPEFGCQLEEDLMEPNDFTLQSLAVRHITDAVRRWEPRITIATVNVEASEHEVRVFIDYFRKDNPVELRFFEDSFERGNV